MNVTHEVTIRLVDGEKEGELGQLSLGINPPPRDMIDLATVLLMMARAQMDIAQQAAEALEEAENILQLRAEKENG